MNSHELLELLFGQLWQVTILCVVAGWISRTLLYDRPVLSYQLWLVVLVKCVTPPIWASHCGVFSWFSHRLATGSAYFVDRVFGAAVSGNQMIAILLVVWLGGSVGSIVLTASKWRRLQKRIRSAAIDVPKPLVRRLAELSKKLGIRRPVELILTAEPIGPAVIGMWRPLLVLPATVAAGKSVDDVEPILAHELLHVRRGDTIVAILETVVRALWWFHPVVQRAADSTSRVGELCCDTEVLGEFRYKPRRYADSLVDVIEAKCRLEPMIATPGIRCEQVTKERLRRIMVSKHSAPRALLRAGLLILALLVFLPGRGVEREDAESVRATASDSPTVAYVQPARH